MRMQIEALEYRTMLAGVVTQPIASFFNPNLSPSLAESFALAKSIPSPLLAAISLYEATKSKGVAPKTGSTTPASTTLPEAAPTTLITTSPVSPTSSASVPNKNGGIVRSPITTSSASLSTIASAGASLQTLAGGVASPALQHGPTFTTQLDTGFEPTPDAMDVPQDSYSTGNLVGQNGWMDEPG